jgi:hypothetical protein
MIVEMLESAAHHGIRTRTEAMQVGEASRAIEILRPTAPATG